MGGGVSSIFVGIGILSLGLGIGGLIASPIGYFIYDH